MLARAELSQDHATLPLWAKVMMTHAASAVMCAVFAACNPGLVSDAAWPWIEGGIAATLCVMAGLPWWWFPINFLFLPAAAALLVVDIPAVAYFAAFSVLFVVNVAAWRHRVPFFLSSAKAARAVSKLLPEHTAFRLLDLGCGNGSLLGHVARVRPAGLYFGIELAPLAFLLSRWRARGNPSIGVKWGDFWSVNLAHYDVVYAYLSPAAMPRLWEKVQREMRPGSLFVSNGFEVPGVTAARTIPLGDTMRSTLHVWRM